MDHLTILSCSVKHCSKKPHQHPPKNYEIVFFDACFSVHVHSSNATYFLKVLTMANRGSECI